MKIKQTLFDVLWITVGTGLYATALAVFLSPNKISPGGLTGLASTTTYVTGIPTGILILLFNIPLFILGLRQLGKWFMVKTILTTTLVSVLIDVFEAVLPRYTGNMLLAALYGGAISGVGFALIFMRGSSTGGADIIAKIVSRSRPQFSMGKVILLSDLVVLVTAAIAYRSVDTALYTFLTILVMSFVIDYFVYGADSGKLVLIVTEHPDKLRGAILEHVRRGATILPAKGAYSDQDKSVILCAVRLNEMAIIHRVALEHDPGAFIMVAQATQILGLGFTKNQGS